MRRSKRAQPQHSLTKLALEVHWTSNPSEFPLRIAFARAILRSGRSSRYSRRNLRSILRESTSKCLPRMSSCRHRLDVAAAIIMDKIINENAIAITNSVIQSGHCMWSFGGFTGSGSTRYPVTKSLCEFTPYGVHVSSVAKSRPFSRCNKLISCGSTTLMRNTLYRKVSPCTSR